jgi:hypothetical protein
MKNIQVIDEAVNCAYSIYQINDQSFSEIFPGDGQDVEFIDDLFQRLGEEKMSELIPPMWENLVKKRDVVGLHGTLFYGFKGKKKFYPNKRESDLDDGELQKNIE